MPNHIWKKYLPCIWFDIGRQQSSTSFNKLREHFLVKWKFSCKLRSLFVFIDSTTVCAYTVDLYKKTLKCWDWLHFHNRSVRECLSSNMEMSSLASSLANKTTSPVPNLIDWNSSIHRRKVLSQVDFLVIYLVYIRSFWFSQRIECYINKMWGIVWIKILFKGKNVSLSNVNERTASQQNTANLYTYSCSRKQNDRRFSFTVHAKIFPQNIFMLLI